MASTAQKREWWADWRCAPDKMIRVAIPSSPTSNWHLLVADQAAPAFQLFADLMREHEYWFLESAGGTYNCRFIGGTTSWSLHAYGIAIDLNPSKNPYGTRTHDFPQGFIDDVAATGLFRWGIAFDDPMHWEIDVPPDQIGDNMPLTDSDIERIKAAVLTIDMPDQDDGVGRRGWTHALKQAWGHSIKAATDAAVARKVVEQLAAQPTGAITQAQIEAIAAEVTEDLQALRWRLDDE